MGGAIPLHIICDYNYVTERPLLFTIIVLFGGKNYYFVPLPYWSCCPRKWYKSFLEFLTVASQSLTVMDPRIWLLSPTRN
jgi:hypothetical protein